MRGSDCKNELVFNYHQWLIGLVDDDDDTLYFHYSRLMRVLDDTPYRWTNPKDESRYLDGRELRNRFDYEENEEISRVLRRKKVSILEVLVALVSRYSDDILCSPDEPSVAPDIFYEILENFGFLQYDDLEYSAENVLKILEKWMDGKAKNGQSGTPFGRFYSKKSDLWTQCGVFCREKWVF